jgi:hypothetical protein
VKQELTRRISVSEIGQDGLVVLVNATPDECDRVSGRMGVPAIHALECLFVLVREGDDSKVIARGRLFARLTRVCVMSAEEFESIVEDAFEVCFVPFGQERQEADPDLADEIPYQGQTIDLGEATSEQLGLVLDPYPRSALAAKPVIDNDEGRSPFAQLSS